MKILVKIFCTIVLFSSCLDEVVLPTQQGDPKIVVDGAFTDLFEKQIVRLSYSTFVENQVIEPLTGAQVVVEDDLGGTIFFTEESPGEYTTFDIAIKGRMYNLKATLDNGNILTSRLQSVPNSFDLDSISIVDSLTTFIDQNGSRRRLNTIHFFAHGSQSSVEEGLYLRYNINTTYRVKEVICSPFAPAKTCYIYNDEDQQSVQLLEVEASEQPVAFKQNIYFRSIDFEFGEVFGLDVGLQSYNKLEYDYWVNLKATFDQNGDITDILPGKLIGNVTSSSGDEVLGQFSVVGKERATKLVRNSDFSKFQNPFCGAPGFQPFPLPDECCSCLLFPNSSLEKPDYWP